MHSLYSVIKICFGSFDRLYNERLDLFQRNQIVKIPIKNAQTVECPKVIKWRFCPEFGTILSSPRSNAQTIEKLKTIAQKIAWVRKSPIERLTVTNNRIPISINSSIIITFWNPNQWVHHVFCQPISETSTILLLKRKRLLGCQCL